MSFPVPVVRSFDKNMVECGSQRDPGQGIEKAHGLTVIHVIIGHWRVQPKQQQQQQ